MLGLNAFGITGIDLFIGIFLLLCCQNILDFGMLWKLIFPAIIILFGIKERRWFLTKRIF